jgi:glycosyltransferase involved in cell wall biosynthesis/GT2 family glycosyltransferase
MIDPATARVISDLIDDVTGRQNAVAAKLGELIGARAQVETLAAKLPPAPYLDFVAAELENDLNQINALVQGLDELAAELKERLDGAGQGIGPALDEIAARALLRLEKAQSFLVSPSAAALSRSPLERAQSLLVSPSAALSRSQMYQHLSSEVTRLKSELALARSESKVLRQAARRWERSFDFRLRRLAKSALNRVRFGNASVLFDRDYYLTTYPDVARSGTDPYRHYLTRGAGEGRNPNSEFETRWYLETYPDVRATGANPLVHYATIGWREGRDPGLNFSTRYYAKRNVESTLGKMQPLQHYLQIGRERALRTMPTRRILLVSRLCPTRAHAGGLRVLDMYTRIRANEPDAYIELLTRKNAAIDWQYDDLPGIFDEIHEAPTHNISWDHFARQRQAPYDFDIVDFQFQPKPSTVERFRAAGRRLLFTPMELMMRSTAIENAARAPDEHTSIRQQAAYAAEVEVSRIVDEVVCVSEPDAQFLRQETGLAHISALETGVSTIEITSAPEGTFVEPEPLTVVYVAYFGSMTNVEALDWYLDKVHPLVKAEVPGYRLDVVGRGDLSAFREKIDGNVNLIGEVPGISPYILRSRVGVAPAISGAGFRGKVNQYAILGTPTVASSLAATGLAYQHGRDILIADAPEDFASSVVTLLRDDRRHAEIAASAKRLCAKTYSWESRDADIRRLYGLRAPPANDELRVHAIVPSYRHAPYVADRIESIFQQTAGNLDLVVIDDCSQDGSDAIIRELQRKYRFRYFRRPRNSGTPFSAWEFAAREFKDGLVWICESDDVAEQDFLARMLPLVASAKGVVLAYCNSTVIDESGRSIGTTERYLRNNWKTARWTEEFVADGPSELADYQVRGMTVPNMSSALIDARAFRETFNPVLKRFRLTGDWVFVGMLMLRGKVAFTPALLNNFRKHEATARSTVTSAREQAEFILTKTRLHRLAGRRVRDLPVTLKNDAKRFLYERVPATQVLGQMLRIELMPTLRLLAELCVVAPHHRRELRLFLKGMRRRWIASKPAR